MYSAYNLYEELVKNNTKDKFQFNNQNFKVSFEHGGSTCVVEHIETGNKARQRKLAVECMTDLHSLAACLLHGNDDLYFTPAGNFTTAELYKPSKRERDYMTDDEKLDEMIRDVLDLD